MEDSFSWQRFDRIAKTLEGLGYLVAFLGPLVGIALLIVGDTVVRVVGLAMIFGSFLTAAYHISFSLLMNAVHDITKHIESQQKGQITS
jgi:hypothetical protein